MASASILEAKKQQVADLKERLDGAVAGVIVNYSGINVADDTKLRKELREAGVNYTVVKNTMLELAVKDTALEGLIPALEGTTALATSADDHVAAARILGKYAEGHDNFTVKGGFLDGEVITLDKLNALAKLPSREVLLSMVCNVFQAPIAAFARVIKAVADNGGAVAVEAPAEAPAEAAEAPAEATAEATAE